MVNEVKQQPERNGLKMADECFEVVVSVYNGIQA